MLEPGFRVDERKPDESGPKKKVCMQNAKLCAKLAVLRIRDPKFSVFFTPDPGSGMRKNSDPGSEIRDKHIGSYFRLLSNNFLG